MDAKEKEYQRQLHLEFLKTIHDEKTKTQGTRATYITSKFAFITGLFGLGVLKVDKLDFHWLLYLVPLVALGYDLYIRAEDLSIKKIGAFLRSDPEAGTAPSEKAWEGFSARYRDKLAQFATSLFTFIITIAAAVYVFAHQNTEPAGFQNTGFWIGFGIWFATCCIANIGLWISHRMQIKKLDKVNTPKPEE